MMDFINKHFNTKTLKGFGIEEMNDAIASCGAILYYLNETKHDKIKHLARPENNVFFTWYFSNRSFTNFPCKILTEIFDVNPQKVGRSVD